MYVAMVPSAISVDVIVPSAIFADVIDHLRWHCLQSSRPPGAIVRPLACAVIVRIDRDG